MLSRIDMNKPSVQALSYALRNPKIWNDKFTWDYNNCEYCAMRVAHELWGAPLFIELSVSRGPRAMAELLGISPEASQRIFMEYDSKPTPEQIADKLDELVAA